VYNEAKVIIISVCRSSLLRHQQTLRYLALLSNLMSVVRLSPVTGVILWFSQLPATAIIAESN